MNTEHEDHTTPDFDVAQTTAGVIVAIICGALMWSLIAIALVLIASCDTRAQTYQTTIRDASGRVVGTEQTSNGVTVFRDAAGRATGTATTDRQGVTTFRDQAGRFIGSSRRGAR